MDKQFSKELLLFLAVCDVGLFLLGVVGSFKGIFLGPGAIFVAIVYGFYIIKEVKKIDR